MIVKYKNENIGIGLMIFKRISNEILTAKSYGLEIESINISERDFNNLKCYFIQNKDFAIFRCYNVLIYNEVKIIGGLQ